MNEKEIAEIRRRYRQGKSNISHVVGCYVNEERQIVARFDQSLTLSGQEEADKFLAILRRTLSGTLGRNLLDIAFTTAQVAGNAGDEHALLMALRNSRLQDEAAREEFFARAIETIDVEGNYLILLTLIIITTSHRYYHIHVYGLHSLKLRFHLFNHGIYEWIICCISDHPDSHGFV